MPYREKSSEAVVPRAPYSPFQPGTSNKMDYALARLDDLVNWGRKVKIVFSNEQLSWVKK